jgi:hypothetical protein
MGFSYGFVGLQYLIQSEFSLQRYSNSLQGQTDLGVCECSFDVVNNHLIMNLWKRLWNLWKTFDEKAELLITHA